MLVKEFLEVVGSGDFTNIDIRNYFASLKDIDKKDLLSELQISAMAEDICGHPEKAGRLYEAQEMLCSIYNIEAHEFSGELYTEKAKKAFAKAIEKGLMEHDGNGYKWIATNSLYGYFVDKLSDKIELKTSNNRIQWNIFKGIVTNHGSIVDTARQAVNDYKNKGLNPPEGDYIVDEILKDL